MKSLIGKFVHLSQDEYYSTGKILDVSTDLLLIENDPFGGSPIAVKRLVPLPVVWEELSIFDTRQDLQAWLDWVTLPAEKSGPRIVSIVSKSAAE